MAETAYKYHYLRYDIHGALRPNWPLKLGLVFLCRHILLFIFIATTSFKGGDQPGMDQLKLLLDPAYNLTDIPAAILFYVMITRSPRSNPIYRWIWRHGRQLIFFSIAFFLAVFAFRTRLAFNSYQELEWAIIAGNLILAFYIGTSRYIRDLFEAFPSPPETEREPKSR